VHLRVLRDLRLFPDLVRQDPRTCRHRHRRGHAPADVHQLLGAPGPRSRTRALHRGSAGAGTEAGVALRSAPRARLSQPGNGSLPGAALPDSALVDRTADPRTSVRAARGRRADRAAGLAGAGALRVLAVLAQRTVLRTAPTGVRSVQAGLRVLRGRAVPSDAAHGAGAMADAPGVASARVDGRS